MLISKTYRLDLISVISSFVSFLFFSFVLLLGILFILPGSSLH
jgi:hypothetical protein